MTRRVPLPEPVARIYKAAAELEALYPGRKFTPDGHLVGSIGEVIAAEALGLTLYPMSKLRTRRVRREWGRSDKANRREKHRNVRMLRSPRCAPDNITGRG
jgi:hypothetical protein